MAKLEKTVQTAQCTGVRTFTTSGGEIKEIYTFILDNDVSKPFDVFPTKYFKPEQGAFYTPTIYVYTSAYIYEGKDGKQRAGARAKTGISWEKVGG